MKSTITYFEGLGKAFTEETLAIARARAAELGIKDIVLASTTGYTMEQALEVFSGQDVRLVAVGTAREKFSVEVLDRSERQGYAVIFDSEVGKPFPGTVINAYRRLSEGVKVCVQIVADAVEAGLLAEGTRVVTIAGTGPSRFPPGGGADTALVMTALATGRYGPGYVMPPKPERRAIHEILCKPL